MQPFARTFNRARHSRECYNSGDSTLNSRSRRPRTNRDFRRLTGGGYCRIYGRCKKECKMCERRLLIWNYMEKILKYAAIRSEILAPYKISIYNKYFRPRSYRLEVAASEDPRANGDSTL
ncbi:hypothetical protein V1477_004080 [Vespula maculifrons]|uniref:Uncharacterized protein n=1 Tax=Vespula maculifrons TaxID=7453 RepID=A0ABD2CQJ1_VESMC